MNMGTDFKVVNFYRSAFNVTVQNLVQQYYLIRSNLLYATNN